MPDMYIFVNCKFQMNEHYYRNIVQLKHEN